MTDKEKTDALLAALYKRHIDAICCEELAQYGNYATGNRRIDFWVLTGGATQKAFAYEIKASRSDFLRDSKEKQAFALQYSDKFYYCAPKGLLDKREIPDWAGLVEYDIEKARWRNTKQPDPRTLSKKAAPDWSFVLGLVRTSARVRRDMHGSLENLAYLKAEVRELRAMVKQQGDRDRAVYLHQFNELRKIKSHHIKPWQH